MAFFFLIHFVSIGNSLTTAALWLIGSHNEVTVDLGVWWLLLWPLEMVGLVPPLLCTQGCNLYLWQSGYWISMVAVYSDLRESQHKEAGKGKSAPVPSPTRHQRGDLLLFTTILPKQQPQARPCQAPYERRIADGRLLQPEGLSAVWSYCSLNEGVCRASDSLCSGRSQCSLRAPGLTTGVGSTCWTPTHTPPKATLPPKQSGSMQRNLFL